jgi:hypothetical protein
MKKQRWTFIEVVIAVCVLAAFIFVGSQRNYREERARRWREENKPDVHPPFYPFDSASLSRKKDSTQHK